MSRGLIEIADPARPGRPSTTRTYVIDTDDRIRGAPAEQLALFGAVA